MRRRRAADGADMGAYGRDVSMDTTSAECYQKNGLAQLLGDNLDAARGRFSRDINLLQVQGDTDAANQLREQVQGIVKLDEEAVA